MENCFEYFEKFVVSLNEIHICKKEDIIRLLDIENNLNYNYDFNAKINDIYKYLKIKYKCKNFNCCSNEYQSIYVTKVDSLEDLINFIENGYFYCYDHKEICKNCKKNFNTLF